MLEEQYATKTHHIIRVINQSKVTDKENARAWLISLYHDPPPEEWCIVKPTIAVVRQIIDGLVATIEGMPQEVKAAPFPTLAALEAKVRGLTKERDEYRTQFEKATWDNDALRKAGEGVSSKEHNTLRQEANNSAVKCERLEYEVKRLTDCLRDIQGAREEEARRLQEISEMQRTANANYQREHKRALALDHLVKALVGVLYAGEVER